ncbi:fatty acyl-AMP ligase [Nocardia sp. NPDC049526]|uniref:fatty acyl-AMP ligase n=1 Tax=Nocardia sp. NPDC049526 TaxID=3364316 RepID=UPI00378ACC7C
MQTRAATFLSLLEHRGERQGSSIAYRFLADGSDEGESLTFAELDCYGRAIGAHIQESAERGDRALILAPDGYDFCRAFVACQYANVIAVPAYPPFPAGSGQRVQTLRSIARNCRPRVVLAAGAAADRDAVVAVVPELATARWLVVDRVVPGDATRFVPTTVVPEDISFLQYTSGSTSEPKGVVITHDALMHNERLIASGADLSEADIGVSWLPLYHDMGLIGNLLGVVYTATPGVFMSPMAFLHRPARWLQAITKYRATISGAPNFAYDLCVRRISEQERAELDLSSWKLAFSGAEPVRAETLDAFARAFGPYGFDPRAWYPCYGLAESTVMVSGAGGPSLGAVRRRVAKDALAQGRFEETADADYTEMVGCGTARLHRSIVIADPVTLRRCADGEVGEIWAAGPDIGRGYWGRPEESEHVFGAHLADTGEGPFLRTGDLGVLRAGELFVTGRLKDLIIIAGRNHYPQDIEATVEAIHPNVRSSIVFTFGADGAEKLAVVAETTTRKPEEQVRIERLIRSAVSANHGLRAHRIVLVKPNSVPRTSSGKPRRSACRTAFQRGELVRLNNPVAVLATERGGHDVDSALS